MSSYTVGDRVQLVRPELFYRGSNTKHTYVRTAIIVADDNPAFPGVFVVCECPIEKRRKEIAKFLDRDDIRKILEHLSIEEMLTHPQPAIREAAKKKLSNE